MSMFIVQIGSYPLSSAVIRGGVEASVYGLSQELGKSNDVHVFDNPRKGGVTSVDKDGNVTMHRAENPGKWQVAAIRQVKKMAQEVALLHPDVCHIHSTNLFSWLMYKRLKKEGLPCVVTVHGLALVEKRNALKKKISIKSLSQYVYQGWVEKQFLKRLPFVIVDTEYVREKINRYPIRKKPMMHVIPQGISEDYFSLHCSPDSHIILSVGAIGPRKGHLLTLRAFERLREEGVETCLVIAGTVADQAYLEQFKSVLANSRYKDDVRLYTNLPNEELKQLYKEAHVFALHSEEESQGIVFAEAMAAGLPIVATRVGGIPCVVRHERNGLLADYGDVKTFSGAMERLMTDENKWQAMSEASKQMAQDYHWSAISDKVLQLYHTLAEIN